MGELADHLRRDVPLHHRPEDETGWREIAGLIGSIGLEPALLRASPGAELEAVIVDSTARLIAAAETRTIAEVFAGTRRLRLTRLVPHLLKPDAGIPIVTTNYDRLVEIAAEEAGLGVDCMFMGGFAGRVDEDAARLSHCRESRQTRGRVRMVFANRVVVSNPHGSLDWYARAGEPVRYAGELPGVPRLIVPPGRNKFRTGYDRPFDRQRERANRAIDEAARLLILGYGFADEHLETHLRPALAGGKPALVLTWAMTDAVRCFVHACPNVFKRGADSFPQIDRSCFVLAGANLQRFMGILGNDLKEEERLRLGVFVADRTAEAIASGDSLFQRHAAVLGSTRSAACSQLRKNRVSFLLSLPLMCLSDNACYLSKVFFVLRFTWAFVYPFLFRLMAEREPSGRAATVTPLATAAASTVAPLLGGALLERIGLGALLGGSAALVLVGLLLELWIAPQPRKFAA